MYRLTTRLRFFSDYFCGIAILIGQFYGPYSTVRPAKFESSPDVISFVYQNLLQRKF